eukprot:s3664_g3.t1
MFMNILHILLHDCDFIWAFFRLPSHWTYSPVVGVATAMGYGGKSKGRGYGRRELEWGSTWNGRKGKGKGKQNRGVWRTIVKRPTTKGYGRGRGKGYNGRGSWSSGYRKGYGRGYGYRGYGRVSYGYSYGYGRGKGRGKGRGRGKGKGKGKRTQVTKEFLDKQLEEYMGPDAIKAMLNLELEAYFKVLTFLK